MQPRLFYLQVMFLCVFISCTNHKSRHTSKDPFEHSAGSATAGAQNTSAKTIFECLSADTSCTIFFESLESTDLLETLNKPGPFILFAPSNDAFRKLPKGTFDGWMNRRKIELANILSYHIVAGSMEKMALREGQKLKTLAGEELIVTVRTNGLIVNGTTVTNTGVAARNGIIYPINGVLFPRHSDYGIN